MRSFAVRIARTAIAACAIAMASSAAEAGEPMNLDQHIPAAELKKEINRFAAVDVRYDENVLSAAEKLALEKLVMAADAMNEIFLRQVWAGNEELRRQLVHAAGTDAAEKDAMADLYHFFRINFGPWNRLEHDRPFLGNVEKPGGAGYYPEDMSKEEFETYCAAHPEQKEVMTGYFARIERAPDGSLTAVPYSVAYREYLEKAAKLMNEAAAILTDPRNTSTFGKEVDYASLATFLKSRAAAFDSNDYFQSDMDWMDVKNNIIDVTIGPYEVYEDGLFAYKAAFEGVIAIRNPADSRTLETLKNFLPGMERNLPIPDAHKNLGRGSDSPIAVVDVVYSAGDIRAGVHAIAFNLPNDERVREAKGSKKVMLKNISRAKYDKILVPIADIVLDAKQRPFVNFDSYFSNGLMHELAHGLGPGTITLADGSKTTVNQVLKTLYSPLEEAKADIMGLYNKEFLVQQGTIAREELNKSYVCFLPGFFRAIRFGTHEAHGQANLIEYNYLKAKGAITLDAGTDRFTVQIDKMPAAVRDLTRDLCMIQANGDYAAAEKFIATYTVVPDELTRLLGKLGAIPTDVEPVYAARKFVNG